MAGFGFGFGAGQSRRSRFEVGEVTVADALEQHGVTFTFAAPRPVGQYANGDWWVRGPVTITAISPQGAVQPSGNLTGIDRPFANRVINGTMVNPGQGLPSRQGWDSISQAFLTSFIPSGSSPPYQASLNLDPGATGVPLVLSSGSVVKFVSMTAQADLDLQARPAGSGMVVLTVVNRIPAPGSIRPGVSRISKASVMNIDSFDLTKLNSFPAPASAPTFEQALAWVSRYIETAMPDSINNVHCKGRDNHPEYGRDIGNNIHRAMLLLHTNLSSEQKRALIARLATIADDIISCNEAGGTTLGCGGGNQWKKPVVCMMGALLGSAMPAPWATWLAADKNMVWGEDQQLFNVSGFEIATPRHSSDGRPRAPYTYQMLGSAEWGEFHNEQPERSGANWNAFYRDIVAYSLIGGWLAVQLTPGAAALWDNPRVAPYMDTVFLRRNEGGPGNSTPLFVKDMLEAHRPVRTATPVLLDAGIKDAAIWLRYDVALNEVATPPATSAFVVKVNGSPVAVESVTIWRQNIGLALAVPVTGSDVVSVSYTAPSSNPARNVDGINVASFTDRALTNLSDTIANLNTQYPVVQFTDGVRRMATGANATALAPGGSNALGTFALLKFRFEAAPAANVRIFGNGSGVPPFRISLNITRTLEFNIANPTGTLIIRFSTPPLTAGVDHDILIGFDITQPTAAAGISCYINGVLQTLNMVTWVGGAAQQIGWGRESQQGFNPDGAATFQLGAFWLDATTRVDLADSANRAKFTQLTNGSLAIGTLGDGITGAVPAQFVVGNAEQWNAGAGINRGTGNKFFPTAGSVTLVSGGAWA